MDCLVNMEQVKENIEILEEWLKNAESLAHELSANSKKHGDLSFFTISTTVKVNKERHPYLTPLRKISKGFIGGSVVFSQTQAVILGARIDGIVDYILVDAEKKIGITIGSDNKTLKSFGFELIPDKQKSRIPLEMGNLSGACISYIKKSKYQEFKPNDITVESVWHFLSGLFDSLSGKRIAIIGSGNIGFKLALKLVECGCHVELVRRDMMRGTLMANAINVTKPISTLAIAHYNNNALQASLFCDALIGCTNGVPAINIDMIQSMSPKGIIIDVGKGSVFKEALAKAVQSKIKIIRCDIYSALDGFISTMYSNKIVMSHKIGRREIEDGVFVVSGGYMGLLDDVVVDDYLKPSQIVGVANGIGDFKSQLNNKNHNDCKTIKESFDDE